MSSEDVSFDLCLVVITISRSNMGPRLYKPIDDLISVKGFRVLTDVYIFI